MTSQIVIYDVTPRRHKGYITPGIIVIIILNHNARATPNQMMLYKHSLLLSFSALVLKWQFKGQNGGKNDEKWQWWWRQMTMTMINIVNANDWWQWRWRQTSLKFWCRSNEDLAVTINDAAPWSGWVGGWIAVTCTSTSIQKEKKLFS